METKLWEDGRPNPYHSLLDAQRIHVLENNIRACSSIPGAGVEVGVYHGGSLIRIARHVRKKTFYGIDTFEGMPEPSDIDLHKKGGFSDCDYTFLKSFFKNVLPRVILIKGFFPDEQVLNKIKHNKFCFVHIDADLYRSTKDCLEYFVPKLSLNGVLIVDDYGFVSTPGAKKAVDEYIKTINSNNYSFRELKTKQFRIQKIK